MSKKTTNSKRYNNMHNPLLYYNILHYNNSILHYNTVTFTTMLTLWSYVYIRSFSLNMHIIMTWPDKTTCYTFFLYILVADSFAPKPNMNIDYSL